MNLWRHGKARKVLEYHDLLPVAVAAAERAAAFIRQATRPRDPASWGQKGISDFVTEVDLESERIITDYLLQQVPDSAVRGEEFTPEENAADLVWVVDPLDGTTNYLHGYPAYAVSIAAVMDGSPKVGVVLDVSRDLTYTAVADDGAWQGDVRLRVSGVTDPGAALIGTGFPFKVPDSAVRGEEFTPEEKAAELVWVVDPLDGTTNYLHGYPAYAVSIAAVTDGSPKVGVVLDVCRDLTYTAVAADGAWQGDVRLRVSDVTDPATALIGTGFPFKVPDRLPQYIEQFAVLLRHTSGIRRAGSAALDLVDLALGRFDGFWELQLAPWDVAAGTLLVREAGGVVTDSDGSHDVIKHGSIVAGNPVMHDWLLASLRAA